MSELKMISPLLDHMQVEKESAGRNGRTCYTLRQTTTGERFILKRISVPASDSQVRALILSGAYADEAAVHAYFAEFVFNENHFFAVIGFFYKFFYERGFACAQKARKNIDFHFIASLYIIYD